MMQKIPVDRVTELNDAVTEFIQAEHIMAQSRNDDVFQTLNPRQSRQLHVVLNLLHDLIYDLGQGTAQEQWASRFVLVLKP